MIRLAIAALMILSLSGCPEESRAGATPVLHPLSTWSRFQDPGYGGKRSSNLYAGAVDLPDGRHVTCVWIKYHNRTALTCDWANGRTVEAQ